MTMMLHELIFRSARDHATRLALAYKGEALDYAALARRVSATASGYVGLGLARRDRVAIYLEKRFETVEAMFGAAAGGCVFVPVNPLLKSRQVEIGRASCRERG